MTEREKKITKHILKWEGGYGTDGMDGGCTNKGVTLNTYRAFYGKNKTCNDLKKITDEQWFEIFRKGFYDRVKGDEIVNDSICLLVVDWAYNSGVKTAIRQVQKAFKLKADGIIGPKTLGALNDGEPNDVFELLWLQRYVYYCSIGVGKKAKYLKGWLNRLNSIKYEG